MYFNGSAIGISYLGDSATSANIPEFDYLKLLGNQKVAYCQIQNDVLSDDDLDMIEYDDVPSWDDNTTFLAQFNNTLESGNVIGLTGDVVSLNIQRREGSSSSETDLTTLDSGSNAYEDLYALGNRSYGYSIYPATSTMIGQAIQSNYIETNWYNWCLTDIVSGTVFLFNLNLKSEEAEVQEDRTVYQTFQTYDKVNMGKRNYIQGSLSAIYNPMWNSDNMESTDYVNALRDAIQNGSNKILKDRKGQSYIVNTYSFTYSYDDDTGNQPCTIGFKFMQVADTIK